MIYVTGEPLVIKAVAAVTIGLLPDQIQEKGALVYDL